MNTITRGHFQSLSSADRQVQGAAYEYLLQATRKPVDWAYEVWDELLTGLKAKDNRLRSIAAQLLCNLARSDPRERILKDFGKLLAGTKDPQFVTARQHPSGPLARRPRREETTGQGGDRPLGPFPRVCGREERYSDSLRHRPGPAPVV